MDFLAELASLLWFAIEVQYDKLVMFLANADLSFCECGSLGDFEVILFEMLIQQDSTALAVTNNKYRRLIHANIRGLAGILGTRGDPSIPIWPAVGTIIQLYSQEM